MMTTFGSSNNNPSCEHFVGIDENKLSPTITQCEECEKEGTEWVALRMCLVCGHVGCSRFFGRSSCSQTFQQFWPSCYGSIT